MCEGRVQDVRDGIVNWSIWAIGKLKRPTRLNISKIYSKIYPSFTWAVLSLEKLYYIFCWNVRRVLTFVRYCINYYCIYLLVISNGIIHWKKKTSVDHCNISIKYQKVKKKWPFSKAEVLNSSPRTPPAYFACLSLLTHLIQIISSLEVRSVHELCFDWHAPYKVSIAPYSLSRGNPL